MTTDKNTKHVFKSLITTQNSPHTFARAYSKLCTADKVVSTFKGGGGLSLMLALEH